MKPLTYLQAHKDIEEYARKHHVSLSEAARSRLAAIKMK